MTKKTIKSKKTSSPTETFRSKLKERSEMANKLPNRELLGSKPIFEKEAKKFMRKAATKHIEENAVRRFSKINRATNEKALKDEGVNPIGDLTINKATKNVSGLQAELEILKGDLESAKLEVKKLSAENKLLFEALEQFNFIALEMANKPKEYLEQARLDVFINLAVYTRLLKELPESDCSIKYKFIEEWARTRS